MNKIIKKNLFRKIFLSKKILKILHVFHDKMPFAFASKYLKRNQANLEKYKILDKSSEDFNKFLLSHHERSKRSKSIARSFLKNFIDK